MNTASNNIGGLREDLLEKERELSSMQDFLLGQDDDLRACLHRVSDLEASLLSNPPRSATNTGYQTPPSQESRPLPLRRRNRYAAHVAAATDGNSAVADDSDGFAREASGITPPLPPGTRTPTSPPTFVAGGPDSSMMMTSHQPDEHHRWTGGGLPTDSSSGPPRAVGTSGPLRAAVAPEPRPAPVAPSALPPRPSPTPASAPPCCLCRQRQPASPTKPPPERREGGNGGAEDRCKDVRCSSHPEQAYREGGGEGLRPANDRDSLGVRVEESDDRVARAERRAAAAEAAERAAAEAAMAATDEARVAKGEAERLRLEGLELSRWREAVLDLRDVLEKTERDGRGRGGGEDQIDDDRVARHARWVSSPALGTLLPHLQKGAKELLSDLVMARARGPAPSTAAASDLARACSTRRADDGERCHCERKEEERNPHDKAHNSGIGSEEQSEGKRRNGNNVCAYVSESTRFTHGICCAGSASGGARVVPAAAAGRVDGDEVGEKLTTSLRNQCETLQIVVQALREKDDDSQERISALEEEVFQASLAAVKQDVVLSTLRSRLIHHDSPNNSGDRTPPFRAGVRPGCLRSVVTPCSGGNDALWGAHRHGCPSNGAAAGTSALPSPQKKQFSRHAVVSATSKSPGLSGCYSYSSPKLSASEPASQRQARRSLLRSNLEVGVGSDNNANACSRCSATHTKEGSHQNYNGHICDYGWESGRAAAGVACCGATQAMPRSLSSPQRAVEIRDRRESAGGKCTRCACDDDSGKRGYGSSTEEDPPRRGVRTPTTDILRRLLYERTPTPQKGDGGERGNARWSSQRSSHCRRLFAGGSITASAADVGDSDGVRRGPGALFSDSACEGGSRGGRDGDKHGAHAARGTEGGDSNGRVGGAVVTSVVNNEGFVKFQGGRAGDIMAGGKSAKCETILRDKLLQARRDFSALRTGVATDELKH